MSAWEWVLLGLAGYVVVVGLLVVALRVDAWLVRRARQQPRVAVTIQPETLRQTLQDSAIYDSVVRADREHIRQTGQSPLGGIR